MRSSKKRLALLFLILSLVMPDLPVRAADPYDLLVNALFNRLTTEQRIGQLIMVTFQGTNLGAESRIAKLIQNYRIGGVTLLANNDNINGQDNTAANVQALVNGLQELNYNATLGDDQRPSTAYLPLFVAVRHEGDTISTLQIGTTPLPTNMALGATWNPAHAWQTGNISGQELGAMGINVLIGPSLDVVQSPSVDSRIGTQTFGGVPEWVGRLSRSYILGVHQGSAGRIAVVAANFPGLGSSDRSPDLEIPVIPHTADELRRIDLVPFFEVTGRATDPLEKADGLQCTSIRYQGQNIRTITRPTCVDEQAFADVMRMDDFGTWRNDGGMVVSDSLGTRAIRRWYDMTPFPHRQIARDALLAGNDVLTLSDFGPYAGAEDLNNITDVIDFFTTLYQTDPVVRARIDQAVRRILKQKLRLYSGALNLDNVRRRPDALRVIGRNIADLYTIARDAVTLIAPPRQQLSPPPMPGNNITIFTDVRYMQQCSACPNQPIIPVNALEGALVRLYGPRASGQIDPNRIRSYTFTQLAQALNSTPDNLPTGGKSVRAALEESDWIIFGMLDITSRAPDSDVIQMLLDTRPDLVSNAKIVVMAFGAPTYLSSTDISKLAAYYGIYGSSAPFVDAAARALFQEVSYQGRLPVSVPGINYDVLIATSPDPNQTIRIVPENPPGLSTQTPTPAVVPTTTVGTLLALRTEPILDRNGHIVPDGTPVVFTLSFVTEGVQRRQESRTMNGVAHTSFTLTRPGQVQITAASLEATKSVTFQVIVAENALAATMRTIEPPTNTPTATPSITPTPTETPTTAQTDTPTSLSTVTLTATATITDTATATSTVAPTIIATATQTPLPPVLLVPRVGARDFVTAIMGLLMVSLIGFAGGWATMHTMDGGLRVLLSCVIGGLIGYIYYASGQLGADTFRLSLHDFGALSVTTGASLIGLLAGWLTVRRRSDQSAAREQSR